MILICILPCCLFLRTVECFLLRVSIPFDLHGPHLILFLPFIWILFSNPWSSMVRISYTLFYTLKMEARLVPECPCLHCEHPTLAGSVIFLILVVKDWGNGSVLLDSFLSTSALLDHPCLFTWTVCGHCLWSLILGPPGYCLSPAPGAPDHCRRAPGCQIHFLYWEVPFTVLPPFWDWNWST